MPRLNRAFPRFSGFFHVFLGRLQLEPKADAHTYLNMAKASPSGRRYGPLDRSAPDLGPSFLAVSSPSPREFRAPAATNFRLPTIASQVMAERLHSPGAARDPCARNSDGAMARQVAQCLDRIYKRPTAVRSSMTTRTTGSAWAGSHRHKLKLRLRAPAHIQTAASHRAVQGRDGSVRPPRLAPFAP